MARVVFEDDRVVHVGSRFDGAGRPPHGRHRQARSAWPDQLPSARWPATPGRRSSSINRPTTSAANFSSYVRPAPRRRGSAGGRPNRRRARYGLWSAMRGGATTILDVGTMPGGPAALDAARRRAGCARLHRPSVPSTQLRVRRQSASRWMTTLAGVAGLQRAVAFITRARRRHDGRVSCMLYPAQLDTCSVELLEATRRAADEHNLGIISCTPR